MIESRFIQPADGVIFHRETRALGGPGSGYYGHAGRPGEVGGSAPDGGASGGAGPVERGPVGRAPVGRDSGNYPVGLTQISGPKGSNPGGTYKDAQGQKWYVKQYKNPEQAWTEHVANAVYKAVGTQVPESAIGPKNELATKWIPGVEGTLSEVGVTKEHANRVLDSFAADVLLDNWDAVGTGHDNVVKAGDDFIRVDQGGTLLYRAQGALKPESGLNKIDEWESFIDKNYFYRQVFQEAGYKNADALGQRAVQQIDRIVAARPADGWQSLVNETIPNAPAPFRARVSEMLEARTALLAKKRDQLSVGLAPKIPIAAPAPAHAPVAPKIETPKAPTPSETKPKKAASAAPVSFELKEKAYQMVKSGKSYASVAAELGMTLGQVSGHVWKTDQKKKALKTAMDRGEKFYDTDDPERLIQKIALLQVHEEDRMLGDKPGHEFHGNQWTNGSASSTEHSQRLAEKQGTTQNLWAAAFILPDGTMVRQNSRHHQFLASEAGTSLIFLEDEGVIRNTTDGIETPGVPTEKQAQLVADAWEVDQYRPKHLDVSIEGTTLGSLRFDGRVTAEAIRNFAKRVLASPRTGMPIHEIKSLGDVEGHPFHGNQWTGPNSPHRETALYSPSDAVEGVLNGEHVSIAQNDVHEFLRKSTKTSEPVDLTNVHVEGHLIFGGEGLNISRSDMPQIPKEMREQFLEEIRKKGVTATREDVDPFDLRPTQNEISSQSVYNKLLKYEADPKRPFPPILAAKDGYILDGHHHWGVMATVRLDHPVTMPVHRLSVGVRQALKLMHDFGKKHGIARETMKAAEMIRDEDRWSWLEGLSRPRHLSEHRELGDFEGHPFRGNQWTTGNGTQKWTNDDDDEGAVLNGVEMRTEPDPNFGMSVNLHIKEPPLVAPKGKHVSAGIIVVEPDGRVWVVEPKGRYGGYRTTFPKGTVDEGEGLQETAAREVWEETGLVAEITGHLIDVERTNSVARFYVGKRVGGAPWSAGWESHSVKLIPVAGKASEHALRDVVGRKTSDHQILDAVRTHLGIAPTPPSLAPALQPASKPFVPQLPKITAKPFKSKPADASKMPAAWKSFLDFGKPKLIKTKRTAADFYTLGNARSGNYGHAGRPGEVGGSAPSGGSAVGDAPLTADQTKLYSEQYADARKVGAISRQIIRGEELTPVDFGAGDDHIATAHAMVNAVRNAEEHNTPLYRGVSSRDHGPIESLENLREGDIVTFDKVTSFTADREVAAYYADRRGIPERVNYELRIEGPVKSVATDALSGRGHSEHITHGRFVVIAVDQPKTGVTVGKKWTGNRTYTVTPNRSILLKQVGVF